MLTLKEFLASAHRDDAQALDWDLTKNFGYKHVLFFGPKLYIHQYADYKPQMWNVLSIDTETSFNTIVEAATYLYTEWYVEESE